MFFKSIALFACLDMELVPLIPWKGDAPIDEAADGFPTVYCPQLSLALAVCKALTGLIISASLSVIEIGRASGRERV